MVYWLGKYEVFQRYPGSVVFRPDQWMQRLRWMEIYPIMPTIENRIG